MSAMEIDDQPLVDPFLIVNEELHDLICQHFTGKEVKDLSTVSKQWKHSIGVSPAAMKKITFVYDSKKSRSKEEVTAILTSERRYSNVNLENLRIPRKTRSCHEQCVVVEKIAPWVKNLDVWLSKIGDLDLKFPKVEELTLIDSTNKPILDGVTPNKLKMLMISMNDDEVQPFKDFLTKCRKLEELHMYDCSSVHVFDSEVKNHFKLKTFHFINLAPMTPNVIHNFEKFLLAQSSSLQYLVLWRCGMDLVEVSFKSLPLLKELKLFEFSASKDLHFTVNPSVETLMINNHKTFMLLEFLTALPNLKTLRLSIIKTNAVIEMIASIAINLRKVIFLKSLVNIKEHYATFRQTNPNVNQQIQWTKNSN